jgi:hypothetical protein
MAENEAPNTSEWCVETNVPDSLPVIRFVGGAQLEPQVDPKSTPTSCSLTLDVVGNLQAALAAFQPLLTLLDTVANIAQCLLLLTEVVTNPFKIPDLLGCIPGLVQKINTLLQLVPIFPQGIQAFITFIVDVIRFIATQLDCVISILESIQEQLDELARIANAINNTDDAEYKASLQELFDCGTAEAEQQSSQSLSALGPIARILCTVRAILAIIPGGKEVQKFLTFPDPTSITFIEDAITALKFLRDALLAVEDALIALTLGLGVLPAPGVGFVCPLDEDTGEEEEPAEDPPQPVIAAITEPDGTPLVLPVAPAPDKQVLIQGSSLTSALADPSGSNKVFFGTAPVPEDKVTQVSDLQILATFPSDFLTNSGEFQVTVNNRRADGGGTGPFEGLDGSGAGGEDSNGEGVIVSAPFSFTVS